METTTNSPRIGNKKSSLVAIAIGISALVMTVGLFLFYGLPTLRGAESSPPSSEGGAIVPVSEGTTLSPLSGAGY